MASAQLPSPQSRWARAPFYFNSAAHLTRIDREKASSLGELLDGVKVCPDTSIFQHTFQTLGEHHFIREGFSNDFAHWAFAACNEVALAERLSSIDIREFTSVEDLRERIIRILSAYLAQNPRARDRVAFEPFYFCASELVVIPTPYVARNLGEFADALKQVSLHAIYYHFIDARLRLKLNSNDFSLWLERELGMGRMADRINGIDIYTRTLQEVRRAIVRIVESAR